MIGVARFAAKKSSPAGIPVGVLVSLLLSGCVTNNGTMPYPFDAAINRHDHAGGVCPNISGVFYNGGTYTASSSGRPCGGVESPDCESLSYALLSGASHVFGNRHVEPTAVQIDQPAAGVLEITVKHEEKRVLSRAHGDFTCDAEGLRLSARGAVMTVLISNLATNESRVFNTASDGSLVMKSEWHTVGHQTVFPVSVRGEGWVRWRRVAEGSRQ